MPYRVDLRNTPDEALDRLIELGALDVERIGERDLAALLPDSVAPEEIARALGVGDIAVSAAEGRDADSVWVLSPRPIHVGRIQIVPAHADAPRGALRLIDAAAFGTGLHPTTAMCLEQLDEEVRAGLSESVLDVGTGSGVLALAALMLGVPRATAIDIDGEALRVAAENARINALRDRLELARGGPDAVTGMFPLVLANVLAASLVEMAPALCQRVGHHGRLVLSGIHVSLEQEVGDAYRRLGLHAIDVRSRAGWMVLVFRAPW